MATIAEIEAKIAQAEAAGDAEAVAVMRERLAILRASPGAIMAKLDAAKKAGDQAAVDTLSRALTIRNEYQAGQDATQPGPATPARADSPDDPKSSPEDIAKFEAANPRLAGRFKAGDALPKAGTPMGYSGGGGRSGGAPLIVAEWRNPDTFGDTAAAMMEGPIAAASAFSAGVTGSGPSPSRDYLANDPSTRGLPSWMLTGLGKAGDVGGAAISTVGAGLSGLIGLGVEVVPGQGAQAERKLAEDALGMSMFAIPELAGLSSAPARVAASSARVAPTAPVSAVETGVAGAERFGIPVMRTDVKSPETFVGKIAQKTGESIPIAGTGGMRARQQTAREIAVQEFAKDYGDPGAMEALTEAVRAKHGADVERLAKQKTEVITRLPGAVETPAANMAIDAQIAKIARGTKEVADQVIPVLRQWKRDLVGKTLAEIELIRKQVGERFTALDASAGRDTGQAAVSAIYGPLRNDMGAFIKRNGKPNDHAKWKDANDRLSVLQGEAKVSALKNLLTKGEATPEVVGNLLFSQKPSDWARLKNAMPAKAQEYARAAIVHRAVRSAVNDADDIGRVSPQKFQTALEKLGPQARAFMGKEDLEATEGLVRALQLTRRAGDAAINPPTGAQALPYLLTAGLGSAFGLTGGVATAGALGLLARAWESTGVKSAMRALAKAREPKAEAMALRRIEAALEGSGVPLGATAAASANDNDAPFRALESKYGGQ
jgi:hypothetical protein